MSFTPLYIRGAPSWIVPQAGVLPVLLPDGTEPDTGEEAVLRELLIPKVS
jgi:hypothetical protein